MNLQVVQWPPTQVKLRGVPQSKMEWNVALRSRLLVRLLSTRIHFVRWLNEALLAHLERMRSELVVFRIRKG